MKTKTPKPKKVRNGEAEHRLLKYLSDRIGGPLDGCIFAPLHQHAHAQQSELTISPRPAGILVARRGVAPVRGVACESMNWHEVFTYDAVNGNLIWKERKLRPSQKIRLWKAWNTRYAGKIAGTRTGKYVYVKVGEKFELAHRIIWEMLSGPIPDGMEIDHIDLDSTNNRMSNLRLATSSENARNSRKRSHSQRKYKGAILDKRTGRFYGRIAHNGKVIYLGSFHTEEEAHAAYCNAAKLYHGEFARTS